jgi:hypothetical protein
VWGRLLVLATALAAGWIAAATAGAVGPDDTTAKVTLSSLRAGARPVSLRITIEASLQCGRPVGSSTVKLPVQFAVPARIDASSVTYGPRAAAKVATSGHTIVVTAARDKLTCHSIAVGPETMTFTQAARLGNPAKPGTYAITVQRGVAAYRGTVTITG